MSKSTYSASGISQVRIREEISEVKASGGKVGRVKDCRGICAAAAQKEETGSRDEREEVLYVRYWEANFV